MIRVQGVRGLKDCIYFSPHDDDTRAATDAAFTWLCLGRTKDVVWHTMQIELCTIDSMGKPLAASVRRRHVAGPRFMEESIRRFTEAMWPSDEGSSADFRVTESAESNNSELAKEEEEAYSGRFVLGTDVLSAVQQSLESHEISVETGIYVEDLL